MADTNDITLGVGINATDAVAKAEELQNSIEEIFKASEGKQGSPAFQRMLVQLSNLYDKSKKAEQAVMEIGTAPTLDMSKITADLFPKESELESVKNEFADISSRIEELRAQGKAKEIAPEFKAITDRVRELRAELNGAKLLMQEFSEGAKRGSTSDAAAYDKEYENVQRLKLEIGQLEAVLNQMQKAGLDMQTTDEFREIAKEAITARKRIEELEEEIKKLKADAEKLKAEGKDRTPLDNDADYGNTVNELSNINNKIANELNKNNAGNILQRNFGKSIVDIGNHLSQLPQMVENTMDEIARTLPPDMQVIYSVVKTAVKTIINFVVNEIKIFATTIANLIKTGVTKAVNVATSAVKALVKELFKLTSNAILSPIKKLGNAISNIGKQANTSAPSLKQIGRAFLQYGLGARSLYRLINKLRTALFEGFANLALVDQPFNAAMSSIISSLEYLKNAFAAAFAPIIQAVAPALSTFINMVAQAVTWVGQLIALLTGQPFKIAVPTFKDYASSTSAGASAAKNAAKAEKERAKALKKTAKEMRTIAGFDDVEILKAPDDNDSSSGSPSSGGGGGGGGGGGLAFQTAPISEGLLKFAEMLKKIWKTADAYDLGVLFSEKLRDLLRAFNNAVPKIEAVTTKIAKILASFLAGFFSVYETFVELGKAIGNVINIFFTTVNAFLKEFFERSGFKNLGKDIYLTIMNALNTIDWDTIYSVFALMGIGIAQVLNETLAKPDFWEAIFNALCNALRATLIRIINFSNTLHWGEIGTAIANGVILFIQNFPVSEFINAVSTFLGGLWTTFYNFVNGMSGHWTEVGSLVAQLIIGLFEDFNPEEFARGVIAFLDGLWDAFMGFVNTPGWDQVVDKIQQAIITFAEEFQWEGKVDGLVTFLNNAISALVDILDRLNLPELFDEIYAELSTSEEFEQLCDNIVQLFIDYLKLKIKLKMLAFTGIGDSIIRLISGGQIGSMSELAQQAAESQYDATNGAINERSGDYENLGANGIANPIADGIKSKTPDVVDKVSNLKDGIIEEIGSGDYNGTATNNMQNFNSGIESQKNNIHGTVNDIQTDTTKTLGTGDYVLIGTNNLSGYNKGMMGIRPTVQGSVKTISSDVQTTLQSGDYQAIGSDISNKYNTGIRDGRYQVIGTAEDIQRGVYDALNDGDWNNIGDNIIEGIWHGLRNGWSWLESKVWNLAVDLYNAACRALGIHSPSKVFAEKVGEMIPAGIGVGITDNEKTATSSVETMAQSLVDSAKNIKLPPIAMGEIVPSNAVSNNDNGQTTLSSLLNVLQSLQNEMVTRDELEELLTNIVQTHMNIDFYIGDEKLARHVNSGNSLLDRRYNPVKS